MGRGRALGEGRGGQDADLGAVGGGRVVRLGVVAGAARRHREVGRVGLDHSGGGLGDADLAVGGDQLEVQLGLGPAEAAWAGRCRFVRAVGEQVAQGGGGLRLVLRVQLGVDLVVQLAAHHEPAGHRDGGDRQCHGRRHQQGEAGPQRKRAEPSHSPLPERST